MEGWAEDALLPVAGTSELFHFGDVESNAPERLVRFRLRTAGQLVHGLLTFCEEGKPHRQTFSNERLVVVKAGRVPDNLPPSALR